MAGDTFSFNVAGAESPEWILYESEDLQNWSQIGYVFWMGSTITEGVIGVPHRFYRISNGSTCSKIIGFSRVTVAASDSALIANQLMASPNNTLGSVFAQSSLANGTQIRKWDSVNGFGAPYTFSGGNWSGVTTLAPGESAWLYNPGGDLTVNFVGLVGGNVLSLGMGIEGHGQSAVSSPLPLAGGISSQLGMANAYDPVIDAGPLDGSGIMIPTFGVSGTLTGWQPIMFDSFSPTGFSDSSYVNPVPEPRFAVGQGFVFLNGQGSPITWTQIFPGCP
jgi:hypothetical protein